MSELSKYEVKESSFDEQVALEDVENNGQAETLGDFQYALEEVILCPDTNFQCKQGKNIYFWLLECMAI